METITAAILKDGVFVLQRIEKGLKPMQAIVGGYIELVPIDDPGVTLYVNEEGKLQGLPFKTAWVNPETEEVYDCLAGDLVAFGPADDEGDNTDATEATIELLKRHLRPLVGGRLGVWR